MPSNYAWIITHQNNAEIEDPMSVGVRGPSNAPDNLLSQLADGKGHIFRMLDDDGIWYYRGRIVFTDPDVALEAKTSKCFKEPICSGHIGEEGFGPLDDFGTPNAGATEIQYRVLTIDEEGDPCKVWASL